MFSNTNYIAHAKNNLKGKYLIYFVVMTILTLVSFITTIFKDENSVSIIILLIDILIASFVTIYCYTLDLNIAKGKNNIIPDINGVFSKTFKTVGLIFLMSLIIIIGTIFFIIPGIYASLCFSQAFYVLIEDDNKGIIECLKESSRLMKGNVWNYILLNISFVPYILLSIITLGIYLFWAIPIMNVSTASFYLYLKEADNNY